MEVPEKPSDMTVSARLSAGETNAGGSRLHAGLQPQVVVGALPGNHRIGPVDSAATGFEVGPVGRLAEDVQPAERHTVPVACPPRGLQIEKDLAAEPLDIVGIVKVGTVRVPVVPLPVRPAHDVEPVPSVAQREYALEFR